jgi:hypothetical protein
MKFSIYNWAASKVVDAELQAHGLEHLTIAELTAEQVLSLTNSGKVGVMITAPNKDGLRVLFVDDKRFSVR